MSVVRQALLLVWSCSICLGALEMVVIVTVVVVVLAVFTVYESVVGSSNVFVLPRPTSRGLHLAVADFVHSSSTNMRE